MQGYKKHGRSSCKHFGWVAQATRRHFLKHPHDLIRKPLHLFIRIDAQRIGKTQGEFPFECLWMTINRYGDLSRARRERWCQKVEGKEIVTNKLTPPPRQERIGRRASSVLFGPYEPVKLPSTTPIDASVRLECYPCARENGWLTERRYSRKGFDSER